MSYPRIGAIYDDLPIAESISRQVADLAASGAVPVRVKMHPITAREFDRCDGLDVLADESMKPGMARVLVGW